MLSSLSFFHVALLLLLLSWLFKHRRTLFAPRMKILLHTKDSFEEIWITQQADLRSLHFASPHNHVQTCTDMTRPRRAVFIYQKMLLTATTLYPPPGRLCIIGLGGGTLTMHLRYLYPSAQIIHIEINPRMLDYAQKFFFFQTDPLMEFHFQDAATFFSSEAGRAQLPFDFIILDAFDKVSTPTRFFHRSFYQSLSEKLAPQGVLLANTYFHSQWKEREEKLYQQIFPVVLSAPPLSTLEGNRILLAFKSPYTLSKSARSSYMRAIEHRFEQMDMPLDYWEKWLDTILLSHPQISAPENSEP